MESGTISAQNLLSLTLKHIPGSMDIHIDYTLNNAIESKSAIDINRVLLDSLKQLFGMRNN